MNNSAISCSCCCPQNFYTMNFKSVDMHRHPRTEGKISFQLPNSPIKSSKSVLPLPLSRIRRSLLLCANLLQGSSSFTKWQSPPGEERRKDGWLNRRMVGAKGNDKTWWMTKIKTKSECKMKWLSSLDFTFGPNRIINPRFASWRDYLGPSNLAQLEWIETKRLKILGKQVGSAQKSKYT